MTFRAVLKAAVATALIVFMLDVDLVGGTPTICVNGTTYSKQTNKCYWKIETPGNYEEIIGLCEERGGTLLHIDTEAENAFIEYAFGQEDFGHIWMGLHYSDKEKKYIWSGGKPLLKDAYTSWASKASGEDINKCVTLKRYYWHMNLCSKMYPGYCQIKGADRCLEDNGGCDQTCITTGMLNRTCECGKYYTKLRNRCLARCERFNGDCDQMCVNYRDSRNCSCRKGYIQEGVKCTRNALTKLAGVVIVGTILATLVICVLLLCILWALKSDRIEMVGKSSDGSVPNNRVTRKDPESSHGSSGGKSSASGDDAEEEEGVDGDNKGVKHRGQTKVDDSETET